MTDHRDFIAACTENWVGDQDSYRAADEVIASLAQGDFRILPGDDVRAYHDLHEAALAVAGAELAGAGNETAWGAFEEALEGMYGVGWPTEAQRAIRAMRARRES